MGFTSISGYIMIFIVVVGMVFVLITTHTLVIKEKSGAIRERVDIALRKQNTLTNLTDVLYSPDNVTLYLINDGNEKLMTERISVYLNNSRLEPSDYFISITSDTNLINPLIWDPGETIEIVVLKPLSQRNIHYMTISFEGGVVKKTGFIIGRNTVPDQEQFILSLNPHRWWRLDGNGNDFSGNNGNPDATIGPPTSVLSQINNPVGISMMYFDGNDEYQYPDDLNMNTYPNPTGNWFAMSLWFNATQIDDIGNGRVIWGQGSTPNSLAIYVTDDLGQDEVFCTADEGPRYDFAHYPVSPGKLYHLGCIYDFAGGSIRMYLNGRLVNNDSNLGIGDDLARHLGDMAIGGQDENTNDHKGAILSGNFIGYIGEFAYWGVNDDNLVSGDDFMTIYLTGSNATEFWEIR